MLPRVLKFDATVAQLDRVQHYECWGPRFDSWRSHHFPPHGNMVSKIVFGLKILFMIASLAGILYAMKILRERGGESITQNPIGSHVAPPVEPATDVSASQ